MYRSSLGIVIGACCTPCWNNCPVYLGFLFSTFPKHIQSPCGCVSLIVLKTDGLKTILSIFIDSIQTSIPERGHVCGSRQFASGFRPSPSSLAAEKAFGTRGLSQDFRICCGSIRTGEDFFQTDLMGRSIFNLMMYDTTALTRCWAGTGWKNMKNSHRFKARKVKVGQVRPSSAKSSCQDSSVIFSWHSVRNPCQGFSPITAKIKIQFMRVSQKHSKTWT